jgi:hypothetical protein
MRIFFKIHKLIFDEQGVIFVVNRIGTQEYFYCPVSQLFRNDKLLAELSSTDVRLISCFAAAEDHQADRDFLQQHGREKE